MAILSDTQVKPPTANTGTHLLSVLDESQSTIPNAIVHLFAYKIDAKSLHNAITHILPLYPYLSGSLKRCPSSIVLDQRGVRFIVSQSPKRASFEFGPNNRITDLSNQLEWLKSRRKGRVDSLMTVELVYFACGGSAVKVSAASAVFDMHALIQFVGTLAKVFSMGNDAMEGVKGIEAPNSDRQLIRSTGPPMQAIHHNEYRYHLGWFTPIFKYFALLWHAFVVFVLLPRNAFTPREFSVPATTCQMIHFTASQLQALKSAVSKAPSPNSTATVPYISTKDALTALLLTLITRARSTRTDIGPLVAINTEVNARKRLDPPLPDHFTGNSTLYANSRFPTNMFLWPRNSRVRMEVSLRALSTIARGIRKSILGLTPEYCQDSVNVLSTRNALVKAPNNLSVDYEFGPDLLVTSLCGVGLLDVDFGGGRPTFAGPIAGNKDGIVVLLDSCGEGQGGSVDVVVSLRPEDAITFFAGLEEEWVKEILG
ncbi:UNVERIFIED_CONTAM: hypothetical protein HDU68_010653 [Siphonaria sp. JEL0065]|nr:hypothetical protein HDU68_010653 [Siphonaria sp. JEL0065]